VNYIKYGLYKFHGNADKYGKDGLFMSGNVDQSIALFGNELAADTLTFVVNSRALQGDGTGYAFLLDINERPIQTSDGKWLVVKNVFPDYRNFVAGAVLDLYNNPDGQIIGRFYVEDVKQVSRKTVQFTCTDCIGVLNKMEDYGGGIWEQADNKTAGQIISEIMAGSGIQYTVQADVASVQVIGRLPRASRRVNLGKLLVATGATVIENQGVMQIRYLGSGSPSTVAQSVIYLQGGSVGHQYPATEVQVTEHGFYDLASDEAVTLFDNTDEQVTAQSQLVVFSEPAHDLTTTGSITIEESNANYAIISGIGTLEGQTYTHTKRVISRSTGAVAAERIVALENNELVGVHNSANVAKRMVNYYKLPISVDYEQLDASGLLAAGTPVNITDPFGTARTGWVRKKSFPIGNKTKGHMNVLVDWVAGPYGSTYSDYRVFRAADITNAGRLNIPSAMQGKEALVMLIGGAGGGQAGYDGEAGNYVSGRWDSSLLGSPATGGNGGAAGAGGERPNILSFQVVSLPAYYDGAAIGAGGAGGASNGALGSAGGATTLGGQTSADGSQPIADIVNFLDGTTYCTLNVTGEAGNAGGIGSGYGTINLNTSTDGEAHICEDGTVYAGGAYENGKYWTYKYGSQNRRYYRTGGAGGGGAAHGADGNVGFTGEGTGDGDTTGWRSIGGAGANAVAPAQAAETQAGHGGHGGGGGGGCSAGRRDVEDSTGYSYDRGTGGAGGSGSAGGQGGDGLIVIYYNA
jgi:hypothetical protein